MFKDYIDVEVKEATTVEELITSNEQPEPDQEDPSAEDQSNQEVEHEESDAEDK